MQDFDFFQCHQAAADHFVQHGQEGVDLFLAVHDFDDQRQVHGEPQDFCRVQSAGLAETHRSAQDRGASQMRLARSENDGFIERLVLPAVAFTDENSQENGFVGDLHKIFYHRWTQINTDGKREFIYVNPCPSVVEFVFIWVN
jgi:hypothetical protein